MACFLQKNNDTSEKTEGNGMIDVSELMMIMDSNGIKIDKEGLDNIAELGRSGEIDKTDLMKLFNSSQNWSNELELKRKIGEAYVDEKIEYGGSELPEVGGKASENAGNASGDGEEKGSSSEVKVGATRGGEDTLKIGENASTIEDIGGGGKIGGRQM